MNSIDIEQLLSEYNNVFQSIPSAKWHYLHKKSLNNCIIHLNGIKGKTEKNLCFLTIGGYIDFLRKVDIEDIDIQMSSYLYNEYFTKMETIYQNRLGFSSAFSKRMMIVMGMPVAIFLCLLFRYSRSWFLVFFMLIFFYILYNFRKTIQRKVMGFGY